MLNPFCGGKKSTPLPLEPLELNGLKAGSTENPLLFVGDVWVGLIFCKIFCCWLGKEFVN